MAAVPDLKEASKAWRKKTSANKLWANFKTHFADKLKIAKDGNQELANIGLVNEVQELKQKVAAYEEKDNERTQEMNLLCQAVYNGLQEMANETKENTNPNPPAPLTDSELKTLMRKILKNNSNTAPTNLTSNKKQKGNPKQQEALFTPPEQTQGAVCTKVDGHDKWTATIMNTHPDVSAKEDRVWCQPCGKWMVKNFNNNWTGTHKAWQEKEKDKVKCRYKAKMIELK